MVSYFVGAVRKQKIFADLEEAYQETKDVSADVNNGQTTDISLSNADRGMLSHAAEAVREYVNRKLHKTPSGSRHKTPEAIG